MVCLDCLPEDQPQPKPNFDVYILKFSMFLVPGIPTILWVLNGKLVEALVRRGNQMFGLFQGGAKQQRIRGSRSSGGGGGHEGGEEEDSHQGEEDTQQSQQLNPSGQGAAGAAASGGASAGAESHYEDINQSSYEKTMKSTDRLLV